MGVFSPALFHFWQHFEPVFFYEPCEERRTPARAFDRSFLSGNPNLDAAQATLAPIFYGNPEVDQLRFVNGLAPVFLVLPNEEAKVSLAGLQAQ